MILIPRKRAWVVVTAMLLATACGAGCGYLLGRSNSRRNTEDRLKQVAYQGGEPFILLMDESKTLLSTLNASKNLYCSDAEIAHFRQLVFRTKYLRDAGRMRDGRMECSAIFGRENLPRNSYQPAITRQDGLKIYHNLPPYLPNSINKHIVFLFQQGDSYVVEDPGLKDNWTRIPTHYESSMVDSASLKRLRPSGGPFEFPGAVIDRDAQGLMGDTLYATLCSPLDSFCTTAYESYTASLWTDRLVLTLDGSLGGLLGAFLVLVYSFIYQRSRNLGQQLQRAIRADNLRMVYQPIVDLRTGRIVAAEALARWVDEDGFAVAPDIFVEIAEQRGFVGELTKLVVRLVLSDFAGLLRHRADFVLNINVTATDLADPSFLPMLDRALRGTEVAATNLAIEVTESTTASTQVVRDTIHELRRLGHSVQIDDFGTGSTSLAYLKDLAIDTIKIDKVFTQAIGTEAVTLGILPQILSMAKALNLQVIAEGLETAEQAAYFAGSEENVLGQGWLFGHPMQAEDLLSLLAKKDIEVNAEMI